MWVRSLYGERLFDAKPQRGARRIVAQLQGSRAQRFPRAQFFSASRASGRVRFQTGPLRGCAVFKNAVAIFTSHVHRVSPSSSSLQVHLTVHSSRRTFLSPSISSGSRSVAAARSFQHSAKIFLRLEKRVLRSRLRNFQHRGDFRVVEAFNLIEQKNVALVPRQAPLSCDLRALEQVTQAAFGQRRKMLRQSLKTLGTEPLALLERAGIAPTARAEDIPLEGFVALARAFAARAI